MKFSLLINMKMPTIAGIFIFIIREIFSCSHMLSKKEFAIVSTLQPFYNTVHYNTVLDITWFKDGSQKCIDYIEK